MKVLIVKTSSMGDIIHTLPALTDAAKAISEIEFDWVAEEAFQEIPHWHSHVKHVIPIAIRRWRKNPFKTIYSGEWASYKANLKSKHYDAIIDAQGLLKSAFCAVRLAQGTKFGLDKHSAREPLAAMFYDQPLAVATQQHAVERVRQLFAKALGYEIQGQGDFAIRQHFTTDTNSAPYLMFQHSTTRFDKHWPEVYWQELITQACQSGWQIKLPWGNATEHARAQRLAQGHALVEVLPKLNLSQVAQTLAGASACVSVDTGLSHLAAALDRPNIILFGPTDPGLVGGYGKHQHCLLAADYPASGRPIEPAVFAPLTPSIVWNQLNNILTKETC